MTIHLREPSIQRKEDVHRNQNKPSENELLGTEKSLSEIIVILLLLLTVNFQICTMKITI